MVPDVDIENLLDQTGSISDFYAPPKVLVKPPVRRVTKAQTDNFWERNMVFMEKKKEKIESRDRFHRKDFTFKPSLCPTS